MATSPLPREFSLRETSRASYASDAPSEATSLGAGYRGYGHAEVLSIHGASYDSSDGLKGPVALRETGCKARINDFFTPPRMLTIFAAINFFNYLDRGIIPGAFSQVGDFIKEDLGVTSVDVELGALQSAFIAGYAVASITFGHMVHFFPRFKLMATGLFIWCGAVLLSGIAPRYWVLLVARVFSGVGEASFQTIVPPYIDDHSPDGKRAIWLATFFAMIPIGTAFGYGYGSVMATSLSWRWAFIFEAPLMAPMALLVLFMTYPEKKAHQHGEESRSSIDDASLEKAALASVSDTYRHADAEEPSESLITKGDDAVVDKDEDDKGDDVTFWEELKIILSRPVYVCIVLGYASFTFTTAGFASFGPIFLKGLKLFSNEEEASLTFGGVISFAGLLGTLGGGYLLDWYAKKVKAEERSKGYLRDSAVELPDALASTGHDDAVEEDEDSPLALDAKLCSALPMVTVAMTTGFFFCVAAALCSSIRWAFFLTLGIGSTFLFATTAGVNLAAMASVPPSSRSFALGVSTICMHSLGDVPSPTIIGKVADTLSPEKANGQRSVSGLRETLFLVVLWLVWSCIFWGLAWALAVRQRKRHRLQHTGHTQPLLSI